MSISSSLLNMTRIEYILTQHPNLSDTPTITSQILKVLSTPSFDTADKCERILELLESAIGQESVSESITRQIIDVYDREGLPGLEKMPTSSGPSSRKNSVGSSAKPIGIALGRSSLSTSSHPSSRFFEWNPPSHSPSAGHMHLSSSPSFLPNSLTAHSPSSFGIWPSSDLPTQDLTSFVDPGLTHSEQEPSETDDITSFSSLNLTFYNESEEDEQLASVLDETYRAMTPNEILRSVFPDFPLDVIQGSLELHGFNIEKTIEHLLQYKMSQQQGYQNVGGVRSAALNIDSDPFDPFATESHDGYTYIPSGPESLSQLDTIPDQGLTYPDSEATSQIPPLGPKKTVCRHYMMGTCYRSDCWFAHDTESVICKFWLQGRCIKGDSCEFAHGEKLHALRDSSVVEKLQGNGKASGSIVGGKKAPLPKQEKRFAVDSEDDFPALGAGATKTTKPASKNNLWAKPSKSSPSASSKSLSAKDAYLKQVVEKTHQLLLSENNPGVASSSTSSVSKQGSIQQENVPSSGSRKEVLRDLKWLETGVHVSSTYSKHRQDAIQAALDRNRLFQKAAEAYLSGNKAAAKALSMSAHALNEKVEQLHLQAAQKIFEDRNKHLTSSAAQGVPGSRKIKTVNPHQTPVSTAVVQNSQDLVIDLHGLHPVEATQFLSEKITSLSSMTQTPPPKRLVIITGTGNHSRLGRASILPAVMSFLREKGFQPKEGSLSDKKGGIVIVSLNKNREKT